MTLTLSLHYVYRHDRRHSPAAYFEELAPVLAEHRPAAEYYQLAERYGVTIADDWIEELERAHGVKL